MEHIGYLPFRPLGYLFAGSTRIYWLYLLTSFFLVAILYLRQKDSKKAEGLSLKGLLGFCFPKAIYTHPSARLDYQFFWINAIVLFLLLLPLGVAVQTGISNAIQSWFYHWSLSGVFSLDPIPGSILYTLCLGIVADFAIFVAHTLQHRVPVLWEFHKTHHSAEVLQPFTVFRMHPADDLLSHSLFILSIGLVDGVFQSLFQGSLVEFGFYKLNLLLWAFYIGGYHLRHSHIWLDYGPFWSQIFISPAQHQIHHSQAPEHYDKNMGFIFAFWDRLFGTLYIPQQRETLAYGINHEGEHREYSSLWKLYWLPFQKTLGLLGKRPMQSALIAALTAILLGSGLLWNLSSQATNDRSPVTLNDLTWMEIRDRIRQGHTVALIPTGGTEQNGPHMILGKHNYIAAHNAEAIARQLGNALVTPVIQYVPEGRIEPPDEHMRFSGTLSVPDTVFEGLLEATARSLKAHGFKLICLIGEHGFNQAGQAKVAEKLNREWRDEGDVQVLQVSDYYSDNGQIATLLSQGYSLKDIGNHAGIRDTSELWAIKPEGIRPNKLASGTKRNYLKTGVSGNPKRASSKLGQEMLSLKIKAAVRQIRQAEARIARNQLTRKNIQSQK